jgi:site-specific recombinase XerD
MPKFLPTIRIKEKKADNTCNVKIRVSHNRAVRYVSTEYSIMEENFDMINNKVITSKKGDKEITQVKADRINNKLTVLIAVMIGKCEKQKNIRHMDMASLMALLRDKRREYDMISLIDDRIAQYKKLGNINYKESFERTKGILKGFSGSFIQFEAVDYNFLKRLEYHMKSVKLKNDKIGMSINSIGVHMRNIRTIFNQAITMGMVELSLYPFRKYKIGKETTRHRVLVAEQIALMHRKEIKDPLMAWARDITMLSFFLIGINMKDLLHLKKIEDGRVNYVRSKGKRPYSIKVYAEGIEIINRYHGEKYLLNTLEKYSYYRNATKRINKKLKDLATLCGIDKPITTYYMRHSWATIARSLGISKDDISYGLGHQRPSLEMTEIYVEEDQDTIDNANRKVIDHIINIPLPEKKNESEDSI